MITRGNGVEDPEEFALLLTALREHFQPVGIAEELLVEKIATSYWRQARVLRCEVGGNPEAPKQRRCAERLPQIERGQSRYRPAPNV